MSFSSETKEELTKIVPKRQCCKVAELAGFLQLAGTVQLSSGGMVVRSATENYAVARWAIALSKALFNLDSEVRVRERNRLGRTRNFELLLSGASVQPLLLRTGMLRRDEEGAELSSGMPEDIKANECCRRGFLKGAFLGGGSVSDPERGYHLEIVAPSEQLAGELRTLLNEYDLNAKVVLRKGVYVVYLKEGDRISDFFALGGAGNAVLQLQNTRVYKDFRNNINRAFNCEIANLEKTVSASSRQVESIQLLMRAAAFEKLPQHLRQVAEVRVNNPSATLAELGAMMDPPLGKSGVNHRLRKLEALAQEYRNTKEE